MKHYKNHFNDKVVYCNCDDPQISNFFNYFSCNFENLKLKKIIAACYKNQEKDLFNDSKTENGFYIEYTGDRCWEDKLKKAYQYFLDTFWEDNGCPKYYSNSLYPIDIHCSAQGIVTCVKLQELDERSMELANKIARWAIDNMQNKEGYFYYQKTKWYTNKIPYIRWSQAWMFYGLSNLLSFNLRKSV